ncbi:hypothetical protein DM01DRAFT_1315334 [Hesseltinella vesiculosa]|uniref:Uncharacterized protein n=1 Tax=Hesseltinella vesiculosa TaxID=101127 RepID=A0A1X2GVF7_9FUNG|nr:hypothetical protein DM01DRAFT_1315334 [Hesseltinella vesiculosa]
MLLKKGLCVVALFSSLTFACEPECRRGVARAFSDFYAPVVKDTVSQLQTTLRSSLFDGNPLPEQVSNVVPEKDLKDQVLAVVSNTLDEFGNRVAEKPLQQGIFSVMFSEKDPFKGDCNRPPRRLTRNMPPAGESWTLEECAKMDFICGNPPSICYHLEMVKERIIGRIKSQLTDHATFDDGLLVHSLVQGIKRSVHTVLTHYGAGSMADNVHVMDYANGLVSNTIRSLNLWINNDVKSLCDGSTSQSSHCTGWDSEIKTEILRWP